MSIRFGGSPDCATTSGGDKSVSVTFEIFEPCPKVCQGAPDSTRVVLRRIDPDVVIDRGAGITMHGERVSSGDQESRFLLNARHQDVAIVFVHTLSY